MKTRVLSFGFLVLSWLSILCLPAVGCPPDPPIPPPCCPGGCGDCEWCPDCSCQCLEVYAGPYSWAGCVDCEMLFSSDIPAPCCLEGVHWSTAPAGDPAEGYGRDDIGCTFITRWHTPGVKTVTVTLPCGSSASTNVTIFWVDKVVETGTNDEGPLYVCPNSSVVLEAKPAPPTDAPWMWVPRDCDIAWSIESKPDGSNPSLTPNPDYPYDRPDKARLSNLDKRGDYVVKAASSCDGHSDTITVTAIEVASLLPDAGTEIDDGDNDPNTKSFVVGIVDPNHEPNVVTVTATPNPGFRKRTCRTAGLLQAATVIVCFSARLTELRLG